MFKKNTAVVGFGIGNFINSSTGATVITGTPVETRMIDGTGAALTNAATYNTNASEWEIDLAAGDMNGDAIGLTFKLTDCLPISYMIKTVLGLPQTTIAATGDAMNLAADAIKAVSYDESTAFPLTAVNGSTLTEAGGTGDQLTAINLPNQTMDIIGDITGNLSGSVGSVTAAVTTDGPSRTASQATGFATPTNITAGTITTVTNLTNSATNGDLTAVMKASVNTEVDTGLNTAIPSTPTADSINEYIQIMKYVMLNKTTVTKATGTSVILKDNDSTIYATVVGAYVEDPTTVVRLRLE